MSSSNPFIMVLPTVYSITAGHLYPIARMSITSDRKRGPRFPSPAQQAKRSRKGGR